MRKLKFILLLNITLLPASALADWAVVPDLTSSTLWQLVSENRAEVVSSVGFGNPSSRHENKPYLEL